MEECKYTIFSSIRCPGRARFPGAHGEQHFNGPPIAIKEKTVIFPAGRLIKMRPPYPPAHRDDWARSRLAWVGETSRGR